MESTGGIGDDDITAVYGKNRESDKELRRKKRKLKSIVRSSKVDDAHVPEENEHQTDDTHKAVYLNPAPKSLPPIDVKSTTATSLSAVATAVAAPDIHNVKTGTFPPIKSPPYHQFIQDQGSVSTGSAEHKIIGTGAGGAGEGIPLSVDLEKYQEYYKCYVVSICMEGIVNQAAEEISENEVASFKSYYSQNGSEFASMSGKSQEVASGFNHAGSYKLIHYNESKVEAEKPKAKLTFNDGRRRIDFILSYVPDDSEEEESNKRRVFESGLEDAGLELEHEPKEASQDGKTCFVKVHAPWPCLTKYAEIMRMNMPLKDDEKLQIEEVEPEDMCCRSCWDTFRCCCNPCRLHSPYLEAYRVLSETKFGGGKLDFGVRKLISQGVYGSAFPLHEGKHTAETYKLPVHSNMRRLLYWEWARWGRWYKFQPLDAIRLYYGEKIAMYFSFLGYYTTMLFTPSLVGIIIVLYGAISVAVGGTVRKYYGEKIAVYFAWLGFYTYMLLYPSAVGLLWMIYSIVTLNGEVTVDEVCDENAPTYAGNEIMCPLCDIDCTYWRLNTSCTAAVSLVHCSDVANLFKPSAEVNVSLQITHLFDNTSTIIFAVFMSMWATLFLEFWKRKQFKLSYDWDLVNYDEEADVVRPEYEAEVKKERVNPVTLQKEPYIGMKQKYSRLAFSLATVLFWIILIFAAVFAVIVYRLAIKAVFAVSVDLTSLQDVGIIGQFATPQMLTTITASCLSLVVIMILNKLYQFVAIWLTHMELPRTQQEFDDSFTFKMFCFQFVNYYSYLFYVAFFKTTIAGRPGNYTYLGEWRWEQCDPGGCMYELSLQLMIIMLGKQLWNNTYEIILPWILNKYRRYKSNKQSQEKPDNEYTRWEQDYDLGQFDELGLFYEYLEMVIQFGFITLFVCAFPLAPFFALLNNIIEIRLDANKFICELRRPLSQKCAGIGVWYDLLEFLAGASVVTNAFTIAITSEAIPRMVYYFVYSVEPLGSYSESTLLGFTQNSLSTFNTSDFDARSLPSNQDPFNTGTNVETCRYRDYRNPPNSDQPYSLTMQYWHVVAGRLAFVIAMEHVVFFLIRFLDYIIPDRPKKLQDQIKREHYLVKQMIIKAEAGRVYEKIRETESEMVGTPSKPRVVKPVMSSSFTEFPLKKLTSEKETPL